MCQTRRLERVGVTLICGQVLRKTAGIDAVLESDSLTLHPRHNAARVEPLPDYMFCQAFGGAAERALGKQF